MRASVMVLIPFIGASTLLHSFCIKKQVSVDSEKRVGSFTVIWLNILPYYFANHFKSSDLSGLVLCFRFYLTPHKGVRFYGWQTLKFLCVSTIQSKRVVRQRKYSLWPKKLFMILFLQQGTKEDPYFQLLI